MNDNDIPVKPWEWAIGILLVGLLIGLVVLGFLCTVEVQ